MLSKEELSRYGTATLTSVFLDRVFQEYLTYDGEMVQSITESATALVKKTWCFYAGYTASCVVLMMNMNTFENIKMDENINMGDKHKVLTLSVLLGIESPRS